MAAPAALPCPLPADGADELALADRLERLIAECIEMRERAALSTRSTHALLEEARLLIEDARLQRAHSWQRRCAPPTFARVRVPRPR